MNAKTPGLQRSLSSDLERVDAWSVAEGDFDELPELDEAMLARAVAHLGGRPAQVFDKSVPLNVRHIEGVQYDHSDRQRGPCQSVPPD